MTENIQIALFSSVATLVVSWGSLYLSHRLDMTRQVRLRENEARLRTFAAIAGQRLVIAQLYVSRFEAFIFSDYHEARWHLVGTPKVSLDLEEAKRWMHKSEDLALDAARANRELFEAVASARVLFPKSKTLEDLTDAVYRHAVPTIKLRPGCNMDIAALDNWKVQAVREIQELVAQAVDRPVEALVEYLRPHVRCSHDD